MYHFINILKKDKENLLKTKTKSKSKTNYTQLKAKEILLRRSNTRSNIRFEFCFVIFSQSTKPNQSTKWAIITTQSTFKKHTKRLNNQNQFNNSINNALQRYTSNVKNSSNDINNLTQITQNSFVFIYN